MLHALYLLVKHTLQYVNVRVVHLLVAAPLTKISLLPVIRVLSVMNAHQIIQAVIVDLLAR